MVSSHLIWPGSHLAMLTEFSQQNRVYLNP